MANLVIHINSIQQDSVIDTLNSFFQVGALDQAQTQVITINTKNSEINCELPI